MRTNNIRMAWGASFLSMALTTHAALTPVSTSGSWDGAAPGTLSQVMKSLLGEPLYDVNAAGNRVQDTGLGMTDQIWTINTSATTALLLEIAGNRTGNNFGIYNLNNTSQKLQIFPGSAAGVSFQTVTFSAGVATVGSSSLTVGNAFGFYLSGAGGTFYSRQSDNAGSYDQMVTLQTSANKTLNLNAPGLGSSWVNSTTPSIAWNVGEYLLGWEDLRWDNSDKDYQDMLVKVSAVPVPEPTTLIAGALLLLPFAASTLRFVRKNRVA